MIFSEFKKVLKLFNTLSVFPGLFNISSGNVAEFSPTPTTVSFSSPSALPPLPDPPPDPPPDVSSASSSSLYPIEVHHYSNLVNL